jgi:ribonucleotide reductase beta subunit family protein with ferritin-like domain
MTTQRLGTPSATDSAELQELEVRASPFSALYAHWERNQWSPLELDFSADRASFAMLEDEEQAALLWIFAHRFHAEFNVARLLAPLLLAAPDYEVQLLLATQVADEHRHLQAVLRVYDEVFGVHGGIDAVRALADENADVVAETLYSRLEHYVARLSKDSDEDEFLAAVVVYHLLGEGATKRDISASASLMRDGGWRPSRNEPGKSSKAWWRSSSPRRGKCSTLRMRAWLTSSRRVTASIRRASTTRRYG